MYNDVIGLGYDYYKYEELPLEKDPGEDENQVEARRLFNAQENAKRRHFAQAHKLPVLKIQHKDHGKTGRKKEAKPQPN